MWRRAKKRAGASGGKRGPWLVEYACRRLLVLRQNLEFPCWCRWSLINVAVIVTSSSGIPWNNTWRVVRTLNLQGSSSTFLSNLMARWPSENQSLGSFTRSELELEPCPLLHRSTNSSRNPSSRTTCNSFEWQFVVPYCSLSFVATAFGMVAWSGLPAPNPHNVIIFPPLLPEYYSVTVILLSSHTPNSTSQSSHSTPSCCQA